MNKTTMNQPNDLSGLTPETRALYTELKGFLVDKPESTTVGQDGLTRRHYVRKDGSKYTTIEVPTEILSQMGSALKIKALGVWVRGQRQRLEADARRQKILDLLKDPLASMDNVAKQCDCTPSYVSYVKQHYAPHLRPLQPKVGTVLRHLRDNPGADRKTIYRDLHMTKAFVEMVLHKYHHLLPKNETTDSSEYASAKPHPHLFPAG